MKQRLLSRADIGWVVAVLLPLIAVIPTFNGDYLINAADAQLHVYRIQAMAQLLAQGDLYPRWVPWFHLGYGYPVFNFYPPLVTYLGGVLVLVGISAPLAFALLSALAWVLGSTGVYALGRRFFSPEAALLAVALWAYAPSRLQEAWNQGALPQIMAMALIPWLLWALVRAVQRPGPRQAALLAACLGLIVLAHQPSTLIAALYVAPAALLLLAWQRRSGWAGLGPRLVTLGGGALLGLGLAMIFLLPLALEVGYVQAASPAEPGYLREVIRAHALQPADLFLQPLTPDLSDASRSLPHTLGLLPGLLGGVGAAALFARRHYGLALALSAAMLFTLFLLVEASVDFWMAVPLMAQLRFPWRILRIGALFLALLGGASLLALPKRWRLAGAAAAIALVILLALPTIYPSRVWLDYRDLSARDEILFEQATNIIGTTSFNEFKPLWGENVPYGLPSDLDSYITDPLRIQAIDPGLEGTAITQLGDATYQVTAEAPFTLHFRQFYFPGWAATLDGVTADVSTEPDFGLLALDLPAGEHEVRLSYSGTPVENLAPVLSLLSLGAVLLLYRRGRAEDAPPPERLSPRLAALIGGGVVGFALLNTLYIQPQTLWFRQQSPPNAPAYMQTAVGQPFGDAFVLLGYSLNRDSATAGGWLDVTLYWRAQRPLEAAQYRPMVQVVDSAITEAWAVSEPDYVGAVPAAHSPDTFVSKLHRLRLFDGVPGGEGRIIVRLMDRQSGALLRLPDGSDTLVLDRVIQVASNGLK